MALGKRGSEQDAMSEINVTPLVDVMLVLLVVFIVTAPLLTQSVKVNLPRTVATTSAVQERLATISIKPSGEILLDADTVSLDVLGTRLAERIKADPEVTVQFNADDGVAYGRVAEAMAVAQRAGITRLSFLTRDR